VLGKSLMNGIGGSGDFTRNAFISIFVCPSLQKGGTDQHDRAARSARRPQRTLGPGDHHGPGIADLRGKSPHERAELIANNCAHPDFRDALHRYITLGKSGQTPQSLAKAFAFHQQYMQTGDMRGAELA
jgi:acyl-CoA hydrolase